jgi:hypothetical protein
MTAATSNAKPMLTVVVSPREMHVLAEASLRSVLADDSAPFDLIYLDILSPPETAAAVDALCAERDFPVIRHNGWIAPSAARKIALTRVATPYVVFIDNDVFVEPGCFARLLACAEETGAGLVGPLYLQGPADQREVHMAGGRLERDEAGAIVADEYVLSTEPEVAAESLQRQQVDFVEYHCVLARTALAREPDVLSDEVLHTREHIHTALASRERGFSVWLEPTARVHFGHYTPPRIGDLAFYHRRWDEAECEKSIAAFCRRWPVAEPDRFLVGIRSFVRHKWGLSHALRPGVERTGLEQPMPATELAQTRTALREQAIAAGCDAASVRALESACDYATLLSDGLYRADGRPFLNHLIGTASVLVRYGFRQDVVLAGLLHAAYTHRPPWFDPDEISRVLASGGEADTIVRGLPDAKAQLAAGASAGTLTLLEGCSLAVEAASEADTLLSGEYRASGRPPELKPVGASLLSEVLGQLEAPGLAATAMSPPGDGLQGPVLGRGPPFDSFRLDAQNRRWTSAQS